MTHDASIKNMVGAVADDFISGTRTPNQAVMSGDNSRYLFVLYRVCSRLKPINPRFVPPFQGQTGANNE